MIPPLTLKFVYSPEFAGRFLYKEPDLFLAVK